MKYTCKKLFIPSIFQLTDQFIAVVKFEIDFFKDVCSERLILMIFASAITRKVIAKEKKQ